MIRKGSPPSSIDWVLPGKLAVGGLPQPQDITPLKRSGIKVILSLSAEAEGALPAGTTESFRCLRYILPDSYYLIPPTTRDLSDVVRLVHQCLHRQEPVFVHCLAGIQRSPTVCIAYLCYFHQMDFWEAMDRVKRSRPISMPSNSQFQLIQQLIVERNCGA